MRPEVYLLKYCVKIASVIQLIMLIWFSQLIVGAYLQERWTSKWWFKPDFFLLFFPLVLTLRNIRDQFTTIFMLWTRTPLLILLKNISGLSTVSWSRYPGEWWLCRRQLMKWNWSTHSTVLIITVMNTKKT